MINTEIKNINNNICLTTDLDETKLAFWKLHMSILISAFTSIFGRLITLNEGALVWERLLISFSALWILAKLRNKLEKVPIKEFLKILGVGVLLGLHWLFFYGSIKYSNVSIGIVCFSSVGLFTAFFEPLINHHKFSTREFVFSLITIAGIFLIFQFDSRYRIGIILGTISAAIAALYSIANKRVAERHASSSFMLVYELLGGLIVISAILPFYLHFFPVKSLSPTPQDLLWLILLSLGCTIGLYLLQIQALKKLSAFTVNLTYNLEPVYTIALAMLIFNEAKELNFVFYIGMGLILISVVLQTACAFKDKTA